MKSAIDIFAEGARDGVYPGGQLLVSRQCERLVSASVGTLSPGDPRRVTNDTIYDLASLTKPLATALLVGRAVERGLCAIEDPISKYVPGVDPRVTIEHALEHAAGFPAHRRFDLELPSQIRAGTWDAWEHIVMAAASTALEASPRARSVYSDIGYILLGAALEVIYSLPLSTAFALMGTPLVFRDRRGPPAISPVPIPHPIAPTEDCPPGYVHDENARAMGGVAGHAGLFGSAQGVLRLVEQLVLAYHGWKGGLLQPQTVRRMWRPSAVPGSTRTLGWDRPSEEGASTGGRWPSRSVGHLGFTGTSVWVEPELGFVVVLVTNRVCPTRANNLIRRLRPALHDAAWSEWGAPMTRRAPRRMDGGVHTRS